MRQLLYFLPLLLFLIPATLAECNTNHCVLSCDGCAAGDRVADPTNCQRYYRCQGSGENNYYETPFACSAGTYFNASIHQCLESADCADDCEPNVRSCSYECPKEGEALISNRFDCSLYYRCEGGSVSDPLICDSSAPYFNGEKCQEDESQCCSCRPYCSLTQAQNNDKVPDSRDCRRFYICFVEGTPTDFLNCPDGTYYDEISKRCLKGISCARNQCTNVVGEDGCIEPFTCLTKGYFARCPNQCTPDYYYCRTATFDFLEAKSCIPGTVFHPTTYACVSPSKCT